MREACCCNSPLKRHVVPFEFVQRDVAIDLEVERVRRAKLDVRALGLIAALETQRARFRLKVHIVYRLQ